MIPLPKDCVAVQILDALEVLRRSRKCPRGLRRALEERLGSAYADAAAADAQVMEACQAKLAELTER